MLQRNIKLFYPFSSYLYPSSSIYYRFYCLNIDIKDSGNVLRDLAHNKEFNKAIEYFNKLQYNNIKIDHVHYYFTIRSGIYLNNLELVLKLYEESKKLKYFYTSPFNADKYYSLLINFFGSHNLFEKQIEVLEDSRSLGFKVHWITFMSIFKCLHKLNKKKEALQVLQDLCNRNEVKTEHFAYVIKIFSNNPKKVSELMNQMKEIQLPINKEIFCILLHKTNSYTKATNIVKEMKQYSIEPDISIFNILIRIAANNVSHNKALYVYNNMIEKGIQPDIYTLKTLARFDITEALKLYKQLKNENITLETYNFLLLGCKNKYEQAKEIFNDMKINNISLNVVSYNMIISSAYNSSPTKYSTDCFNYWGEMATKNIKPNLITYNYMITNSAKYNSHKALLIYKEMISKNYKPKAAVYYILCEGLAYNNHKYILKQIAQDMKEYNIKPDSKILNIFESNNITY